MSKSRKPMFPCPQSHTLAIARWEDNSEAWLEGNYLQLISKKTTLQKKVGQGGTLWIIVSKPNPQGGRSYALTFRLNDCWPETYPQVTTWGQYAVVGDPATSLVMAPNDATLILLSLRFNPYKPIKNRKKISSSLVSPRCLNQFDIELLQEYAQRPDRWGVFVSYRSLDKQFAERMADTLRLTGVNVFRDKDSLRGGTEWWPDIKRAITRSRYFVLWMGKHTHRSSWIRSEIQVAHDNRVKIIPVLAGADLENWQDRPEILKRHALSFQPDQWSVFVRQLLEAIGSPLTELS